MKSPVKPEALPPASDIRDNGASERVPAKTSKKPRKKWTPGPNTQIISLLSDDETKPDTLPVIAEQEAALEAARELAKGKAVEGQPGLEAEKSGGKSSGEGTTVEGQAGLEAEKSGGKSSGEGTTVEGQPGREAEESGGKSSGEGMLSGKSGATKRKRPQGRLPDSDDEVRGCPLLRNDKLTYNRGIQYEDHVKKTKGIEGVAIASRVSSRARGKNRLNGPTPEDINTAVAPATRTVSTTVPAPRENRAIVLVPTRARPKSPEPKTKEAPRADTIAQVNASAPAPTSKPSGPRDPPSSSVTAPVARMKTNPRGKTTPPVPVTNSRASSSAAARTNDTLYSEMMVPVASLFNIHVIVYDKVRNTFYTYNYILIYKLGSCHWQS